MRYGSVCSGIEAATVAWRPLGWDCAFVSEIEKFPSAVLAERLPSVPNLGDFTKIEPGAYEGGIDLLVGGTPCQAFSVAGLRKGLSDARGNLALEFARLAYRTAPRWVVWENVPGVLSSGGGGDFAAFLSLLVGWEVKCPGKRWLRAGIANGAPGCYSVAWRVLDAQYTRVEQFPRAIPQRRKRVILVGSLVDWRDPAKVLLDGEMRGGDRPPRREAREDAAADAQGRAGGGLEGRGVGWWDGGDVASTLTARGNDQAMPDHGQLPCVIDLRWRSEGADGASPSLMATDHKTPKAVVGAVCPTLDASYPGKMNSQDLTKLVCYESHPQDSRIRKLDGVSPAIPAKAGSGAGNVPVLVQRVFAMDSDGSNGMNSPNPLVGFRETDVSKCLDATNPSPAKNQGGMAVVTDACYPVDMMNVEGRGKSLAGSGYGKDGSPAYTLTRNHESGVCAAGVIRRLMPIECERLMGFPDGWTKIPWRGKTPEECPDGPRYKALGNSMCTNVMAWVGERIDAVQKGLL